MKLVGFTQEKRCFCDFFLVILYLFRIKMLTLQPICKILNSVLYRNNLFTL